MSAQPLTSCEALGKRFEFLKPQLLNLLHENDTLFVMKAHPGHIMALGECLVYSEHLASSGCDC